MAIFLANSGGAWDNAKKMVEDGLYGGKRSSAHEATIIGDTVGDPFKDTAGPSINPLIKVMNLVAVLVAPAVVKLTVGAHASIGAAAPDRPGRRVAIIVGAVVHLEAPQDRHGWPGRRDGEPGRSRTATIPVPSRSRSRSRATSRDFATSQS